MMATAQRAPMRRWLSAVYIAMHSVELGVPHTAGRCAIVAGGFVRARLWDRATRLGPCRERVALILDNQLPYVPCVFGKDHHTGFLCWVGLRQGHVYKSHPMATAALARTTQAREPAQPTTDVGIAGLSLDLTVDLRVGVRSVYVTVEVLTRSARRQAGPRMRDIIEVAVLRRLYRRWFDPDCN